MVRWVEFDHGAVLLVNNSMARIDGDGLTEIRGLIIEMGM
jgi:hypothetical protein